MSKQVLGEFRGKIGDVVGKVRNGKHYISSAPGKYNISKKPHEVDKRNRFRVNGLFAKTIRHNELLFMVWNDANIPANNAFNKICKVNFKLCEPDRPSAKNVITPPGFWLPVTQINSDDECIEITLNPFEILPGEDIVTLIMYISFYDPVNKNKNFFEMCPAMDYEPDDLKFLFRYGFREKQLAQIYNHKTIFLAAVTQSSNGNVLRWSETVGREL
ncbi:MAG: hypothetical protein IPM56_17380 [Ignavibacteriales bacterium]|nr:MAG: hypothetical protein IPM56_17380 [Ignavibacteriales bacterium]